MADLLPCPFCGGEASDEGHIRFSAPLHDTWWPGDVPITEAFYVNCVKCGAVSRSGIVGGYQTKAEAIERWNTRVSTNKDETIAKLREALLGIEIYSQDTLTGSINPADSKERWYADAVREVRNRARTALTSTKKEG